jgi:hypothetical protein
LKLEYLGKLTSFFETILECESEAWGDMFDEKNRNSRIGIRHIQISSPLICLSLGLLYRMQISNTYTLRRFTVYLGFALCIWWVLAKSGILIIT